MNYYAILVDVGDTTFVDGHYADKALAQDAFGRWKKTYPNLHFDLCAVMGRSWPIADELFMPNNRKTLEIANERGTAVVATIDENVTH
tara:strand:- start:153 stop:416 length:264 start_codon:yes stop_codon:yes gene_type:complete